jgi:hypothetical protein
MVEVEPISTSTPKGGTIALKVVVILLSCRRLAPNPNLTAGSL